MSISAPETTAEGGAALLSVTSLSAHYGELRAIYDISIELGRGEVLA